MLRRISTVLVLLTATAIADDTAPAVAPADPVAMGIVRGKLTDKLSGEGLPAATILIAGQQSLATELDGSFSIPLPPGSYQLTFSTPEFTDITQAITWDPLESTCRHASLSIL